MSRTHRGWLWHRFRISKTTRVKTNLPYPTPVRTQDGRGCWLRVFSQVQCRRGPPPLRRQDASFNDPPPLPFVSLLVHHPIKAPVHCVSLPIPAHVVAPASQQLYPRIQALYDNNGP